MKFLSARFIHHSYFTVRMYNCRMDGWTASWYLSERGDRVLKVGVVACSARLNILSAARSSGFVNRRAQLQQYNGRTSVQTWSWNSFDSLRNHSWNGPPHGSTHRVRPESDHNPMILCHTICGPFSRRSWIWWYAHKPYEAFVPKTLVYRYLRHLH